MNALTTELHDEIAKIAFATNHPTLARIQDELRARMEASVPFELRPCPTQHPDGRGRRSVLHPQAAQIAADYLAGESTRALKEKYRASLATINRALQSQGVQRRALDPATAARCEAIRIHNMSVVRPLMARGMGCRQIARATGWSETQALRIMNLVHDEATA